MAYSLFTCLEFTISVSLNNQALDFVQLNGKNKLWRYNSLRGRRLTGKGKGVLGARETRVVPRISPAHKTPFPFPFKCLPRRLLQIFWETLSECCFGAKADGMAALPFLVPAEGRFKLRILAEFLCL